MRLFLVIFSVVPFFSWSKPLSNACFELAMETRFGTLKPIRERQNQSEWGDRFWIDSERGTLLEWNGTEVVERSFRASRGTPSPVPQLKRQFLGLSHLNRSGILCGDNSKRVKFCIGILANQELLAVV